MSLSLGEPQKPVILSPESSPRKDSYRLRWSVRSPYKISQQKVNYWEKGPTAAATEVSGRVRQDAEDMLRKWKYDVESVKNISYLSVIVISEFSMSYNGFEGHIIKW